MKSRWEKFKHRTLTKVFLGYAVVAWVLIQVIEAVLPTFETPLWVAQTITFLLILGFPIAILIGWASEKLPTLTDLPTNAPSAPQPAHATPTKSLIWIGVGSCIVVGLFGFYMMPFIFDGSSFERSPEVRMTSLGQSASQRVLRAQIDLGISREKNLGLNSEITLSRDGTELIYRVARPDQPGSQYYVRDLRSFNDPIDLQRSGLASADRNDFGYGRRSVENMSGFPSFQNDNDWLYYYSDRGSKLNRVRTNGGTAQVIQEGSLILNSFTIKSDELYYGTQDGEILKKALGSEGSSLIFQVENEGEKATWLEFIEDTDYLMATILPVRFNADQPKVVLINILNGSSETIIQQGYQSKYAKSGHLTYLQEDTLWALPFDASDMSIQGTPVPVINEVESTISPNLFYGNYDFSEDGRLVYVAGQLRRRGSGNLSGLDVELATLSHEGQTSRLNVPESSFAEITASPSQNSIAMTRLADSGGRDVWVWDLERETLGRRSFGGEGGTPVWSEDGQVLFYQSEENVLAEIWKTAANGSSSPEFVSSTPFPRVDLETTSPSGDHLVYSENSSTGGLYLFDLSSDNPEALHTPLITPPGFRVNLSRISPDGYWIAYLSNETGERQVYVQSFPDPEKSKYQITSGPRVNSVEWHPDGDRLYFTRQTFPGSLLESQGETQIFQVDLEYGPPLEDGRPEFLNTQRAEFLIGTEKAITSNPPNFSVLNNNEFVMINDTDQAERSLESSVVVNVIENWFDELETLAPRSHGQ